MLAWIVSHLLASVAPQGASDSDCRLPAPAAALHLASHGANVLVLEAGHVGRGTMGARDVVGHAKIRVGDESEVHYSSTSGSAVLPRPVNCVKMAIRLYACSTRDYIRQHGRQGARAYLQMAARGIEYIKKLAPAVLPDPTRQLRTLGSLYVSDADGVEGLEEEFRLLRELGCDDCELWDKSRVEQEHGSAAGFVRGIYFPNDAVLDSHSYAQVSHTHCSPRASTHSHLVHQYQRELPCMIVPSARLDLHAARKLGAQCPLR